MREREPFVTKEVTEYFQLVSVIIAGVAFFSHAIPPTDPSRIAWGLEGYIP
jgi:hypothetical protein